MTPVRDNGVAQFPPLAVQATSSWKVLCVKFWVYMSPAIQPWAAPSPTCIETVYESPSSQYGVSPVAMYPRYRLSVSHANCRFHILRSTITHPIRQTELRSRDPSSRVRYCWTQMRTSWTS
jgi:hypothetical protein